MHSDGGEPRFSNQVQWPPPVILDVVCLLDFISFCSFASSSTQLAIEGVCIGKSVVGGFDQSAAKVLVASMGGPLLGIAELLGGLVGLWFSGQTWKSGPLVVQFKVVASYSR